MILTDRQIQEAYRTGDILVDPFDQKQIQAASYDLRVGEQGATTSSHRVVNVREQGFLTLQGGDFGVITVFEVIRLGPQYTARFGLRSKYARKGLIATTGPQIDPGYHGRLIIGITNLTPKTIVLPFKDDLLSVEIHRLEEPAMHPYSGPYQDRKELTAEEIETVMETEGMTLSEIVKTLQSLTQNVSSLATDMRSFKTWVPIMLGVLSLVVALFGILVGLRR